MVWRLQQLSVVIFIVALLQVFALKQGCHQTKFQCAITKKCIDRYLVRNEKPNCGVNDTSDEDKPLLGCHPRTEFRCRRNGQCILRKYINQQISACDDKSDEGMIPDFQCDRNNEFRCKSGMCIERHLVNNGFRNCQPDGDDEGANIQCDSDNEFQCSHNGRCIRKWQVRDGTKDCPGREDEKVSRECEDSEYLCDNGVCIQRHKVGDYMPDCANDEIEGAIQSCIPQKEFACYKNSANGGVIIARCIPRSWINDGISHCENGSDENVMSLQCYNEEWSCDENTRCLSKDKLCDGLLDCMDCSDETDPKICNPGESSSFFQCLNPVGLGDGERNGSIVTSHCILRSYFCDGIIDCNDGSDERYVGAGFKCRIGQHRAGSSTSHSCILPQQLLNDDIADCDDGSDETAHDSAGTESDVTCLSSKHKIKPSQFCDGIFDCSDLSDECLCDVTDKSNDVRMVCENICYQTHSSVLTTIEANQTHRSCDVCRMGQIVCDVTTDEYKCIEPEDICDNSFDCDDKVDELFCKKRLNSTSRTSIKNIIPCPLSEELRYFRNIYKDEIPSEAIQCDGRAECFGFADECNDVTSENNATLCDGFTKPKYCEKLSGEYLCNNSDDTPSPLRPYYICNGIVDCNNGVDEMYCDDTRFYCNVIGSKTNTTASSSGKKISIKRSQVCDGQVDCIDYTDELKCSNHFYCLNDPYSFVEKYKVLDGREDCEDGSDECPNQDVYKDDPLSSRDQLIKHPWLQVWVWLMAICGLFGNLIVIATTTESIMISQIHLMSSPRLAEFFTNRKRERSESPNNKNQLSKCNDILVVNLAIADLLTGVYLIVIGTKSREYAGNYCSHEMAWRSSHQCENLGILVMISLQASIGIMVTLTAYRFYAVMRPWKVNHLKPRVIVIWIFIIWVIALSIGISPALPVLRDKFVTSSLVTKRQGQLSSLYFSSKVVSKGQLTTFLRKACVLKADTTENTTCAELQVDDVTWSDLNRALGDIFKNLEISGYFGYYSSHGVCLPSLYPLEHDVTSGTVSNYALTANYTAIVMSLSFTALFFVAFAYAMICYESAKRITFRRTSNANAKDESKASLPQKRVNKMQKRVGRLVITDFLCHLPVCLLTFCGLSGLPIPAWLYSFTAVVLLPINSALNPFLYSGIISDAMKKFLLFLKFCGKSENSSATAVNTESTRNSAQNRRFPVNPDQMAACQPLSAALNNGKTSASVWSRFVNLFASKPARRGSENSEATNSLFALRRKTLDTQVSSYKVEEVTGV